MGVHTRTIIVTYYTIICDYCGKVKQINNSTDKVLSRREAVRLLGWTMQRGDKVMCSTCRCHHSKRRGE